MAITRIGNPAIADQRGINFRNILINGDQSIAQRGTSFTGLQNSPVYGIDRWSYRRSGTFTSATFSMTQSTDVPTGQGFATSVKWDCTAAEASLPAGAFAGYNQRIEGKNLQYLKKGTSSAESLTASFWVKSNKTGTYILQLRDIDNTRAISKSYTISSANTWEKKIITFPGDTTGAFDNDNQNSLEFFLYVCAGSNYTSGTLQTSWGSEVDANRAVGQVNLADNTSNEWYVTGLQFEAGQVASDFEFLPIDAKLARCQRYFTKSYDPGTAPGTVTYAGAVSTRNYDSASRGQNSWPIIFKQTMRVAPTMTIYSPTTGSSGFVTTGSTGHGGTTQAAVTATFNVGQRALAGISATLTAFHFGECHYTADAEL